MQKPIYLMAIVLAGVTACGCQSQAKEAAVQGAAPAITIPVGPIPGPAVQRPQPLDPYINNSVALEEGRKAFVHYNCSGCHGGHAGGGMGPSLRDQDWIYGSSDAHVFDSIAEGRAHGMPAWGTKIPEDQIWQLVAYIKTLRTPMEAEPPE
jgi:cytochrome c oxidase cbb3-type subunit III